MKALNLILSAAFLAITAPVFAQIEWRVRNSGTKNALRSIAFGNGIFIASDGQPLGSQDGINWFRPSWASADKIISVAFGNQKFLLIAENLESGAAVIYETADASMATRRELEGWRIGSWYPTDTPAVALKGDWLFGSLVPPGSRGAPLSRMRDGQPPEEVTEIPATGIPSWITALPEVYAVGISGGIFTSPDGVSWSLKSRETRGNKVLSRQGVLYSREGYSQNSGSTWTSYKNLYWPTEKVFLAGNYFLCAGYPKISSSTDATNWTERETGTTDAMQAFAYGNSIMVGVGESGRIITSTAINPAPAVVAPALTVAPSVTLKWPSVLGLHYQPEASPDLKTWTAAGDSIPGSGIEMTRSFETTASRRYFRVSVR